MCGIAGYNLNVTETLDGPALARWMLRRIETRGRDASGVAYVDADGVWFDKAPVAASKYANRMPLNPLAHTVLLHTRWATTGDPADNRNNHPFALPGITGIHNGCLSPGWERTFRDLGVEPTTKTDSEAIFALLAYSPPGTAPVDALAKVRGDASIAWVDTDEPKVLHLARLTGRPLVIGETPAGSLVFASTDALLRGACSAAGVRLSNVQSVPEWTHLRIRNGKVVKARRIPHAPVKIVSASAPRRFEPQRLRDAAAEWADDGYWDPRDHADPRLGLGSR